MIKCLICKLSECCSKIFLRHLFMIKKNALIINLKKLTLISRVQVCMCHAYIALNINVSIQGNLYASEINIHVNIGICAYKRRYIQVPTLHLQGHACRLIFAYRSPTCTFDFRMGVTWYYYVISSV